MLNMFKSSSAVITQIEEFFNLIDQSGLVFAGGIKAYLRGNRVDFVNAMDRAKEMEEKADDLRRTVQDALYRHSLMPDFRGDVLHLMELMDDLIDIAKENLIQFNVENPYIPPEIHEDFLELAHTSVKAVESIVLSARTFFRDPHAVKDLLHRVYFYEKEADRMSNRIKQTVYNDLPDLDLSQKNHIRHFVNQAEDLSDVSEKIADLLSVLAIKRIN
jgi:hypothetical protein